VRARDYNRPYCCIYTVIILYIIHSRSDLPRISLFPVFTTDGFPVYFPLICIYRPSIIIIIMIIIIWYCSFPRPLPPTIILCHSVFDDELQLQDADMQWDGGDTVVAIISSQRSWAIPIDYYLKHHNIKVYVYWWHFNIRYRTNAMFFRRYIVLLVLKPFISLSYIIIISRLVPSEIGPHDNLKQIKRCTHTCWVFKSFCACRRRWEEMGCLGRILIVGTYIMWTDLSDKCHHVNSCIKLL